MSSSLRLLALVIIVLAVHLLLLKGVTSSQLFNEHKEKSQKVSIRLLPSEKSVVPTSSKNEEQSPQDNAIVNKVGLTPARQPRQDIQKDFRSAGFSLGDDQLSLDFQLAEIQGSAVKLGELNLTLLVSSGKYESSARWSTDNVHFQRSSEGVVDTIFRPHYFVGDAENAAPISVPENTQDQLSIIWNIRNLALQAMSQSPPDYERTWDVFVQMGNTVYPIHWTFEPLDNLLLPAGRFRAAKVIGTAASEGLIMMSIWYAVDFDFSPIRIEIRDARGKIQDAKISTLLEKVVEHTEN
jgi:hypothetical protein